MNDDNVKSQGFSLKSSLEQIPEPYNTETRIRLSQLEQYLSAYNCTLRDDSRLAFLWSTGRLDPSWDIREVCHEMMAMQFICLNTQYNDLCQPFLRALANGMRDRYGLKSWTATWRIVREYGPDILKIISLAEAGLQVPNFMIANTACEPGEDRSDVTE